jgi:signal transduction histidine kinase
MARVRNTIEKVLMLLTLLSAGLFIAAIYFSFHSYESTRHLSQFQKSQENLVAQLGQFARIQREMGYTRFIHNFKNGVLRRDLTKLQEAKGNLSDALVALDVLVRLNGALATQADDLRETLIRYAGNADLAARLIGDGLEPAAIDRQVKIDDGPASADLTRLAAAIDDARRVLKRQIEDQIRERQTQAVYDHIKAGLLLLVGGLLIWLQTAVRRQVNVLLGARDALARIETRFEMAEEESSSAAGGEGVQSTLEGRIANLTVRIEKQQDDLLRHADALTSANEELERFAYVASHDLQEPLRKIQSNIDLIGLQEVADIDQDTAKYLSRITRAAEQARQLIRDLLEYSRRGTRPLHRESFNLLEMLEHIAKRYEDSLTVTGGRITCAGDLAITGDESMLAQVFANLFENALKYARPDVPPDIRVTAARDGDGVTITVADNGMGFDQKYAEDIFKPFTRLRGRSETSGTGIGLSIVKRVVERHGGTVEAHGRPGEGAVFTVRLAAGAVDHPSPSQSKTAREAAPADA